MVGTGLTMIDVFLTLQTLGWSGTIYAVSRTGLLPLPHFKGSDYPLFPPDNVDTLGLHALVAFMEEHCARLRADGMNPALVVDKLRPFTQRIWRNFSVAEKQEFSRRLPHPLERGAPPHPAYCRRTDRNRAEAKTGCAFSREDFATCAGDGDRIQVTIDPGNGQPPHQLSGIAGQLHRAPRVARPMRRTALFRNLFERGLVRPDELDMGIEVTPRFRRRRPGRAAV